jgi:hypothetical protein
VRGFEEPFGPLDQENNGDDYDCTIYAVWGYDTGTRVITPVSKNSSSQ